MNPADDPADDPAERLADVSAVEESVRYAVAMTGMPFETLDCDPDLADTAAFCAAYGFSPDESANTIVVASRDASPSYAACVVLATTRLDVNGTVRRRLGVKKVSFAPADVTAAVTGMLMGGVTPFGLPHDLPIWIDRAVMDRRRIVVGGGSRAMKLVVPPAAVAALDGAEVVEGLARPSSAD
jgi:prolyl-tRNA editing enzyme YbaK/EbsC (Cys-tRNA(Pro) deacylase)